MLMNRELAVINRGLVTEWCERRGADITTTVIAQQEFFDSIARDFTFEYKLGELGENIRTRNMGDLSRVSPGAYVRVNGRILFEVVRRNALCADSATRNQRLWRRILGHGLLCRVVDAQGVVQPNNVIEILN